MGEWASFLTDPTLGVELLHAHYTAHAYERHTHDYYVVGVIEAGMPTFTYRRRTHLAPPGSVLALDPEEPHDGRPVAASGYTYRMLYIPPRAMQQALEDATGHPHLPSFSEPVVADARVAALLRRLHAALVAGSSALEKGERLVAALAALATRHAAGSPALPASPHDGGAVRRARDYLHAHFARDVLVDELATVAGMSRFHLSRVFQRAVGLPPHAYLTQVRLAEARRLLAAGEAPAGVAAAVGFVDQSHFTRRFKGAYGITPGQFRRASEQTRNWSRRDT
jgi:AraC-like DNA-binding protein